MMKNIKLVVFAIVLAIALSGCYNDKSQRNVEYTPNMYNSLPLEPYSQTQYGDFEVGGHYASVKGSDRENLEQLPGFKYGMSLQKAPDGTVPRADSWYYDSEHEMPWAPYPYPNTPDGYELAGQELDFPSDFECTEATNEKGKELYETFCVYCHGANGAGNGVLVQKGKYGGVPAYEQRLDGLPVGKMYHTLTYGKGVMGSHAGQMTPRERWEVICYILKWKPGEETDQAVIQ